MLQSRIRAFDSYLILIKTRLSLLGKARVSSRPRLIQIRQRSRYSVNTTKYSLVSPVRGFPNWHFPKTPDLEQNFPPANTIFSKCSGFAQRSRYKK